MGIFDGILICSDVDGTFSHGGNSIEINTRAIKYFTDNGGKFTFATGRGVDYISDPKFFCNINSPACLYNGALVWDYTAEKALRAGQLPFDLEAFLEKVCPFKKEMSGAYPHYLENPKTLLKIVCAFNSVDTSNEFKKWAKTEPFFKNTDISKSWNVGVEFTSKDYNKGTALDFLKVYLKGVHTVVGIGDYDNDMSLVTHADFGVATGNAVPELKKIADFITVDAKDGAVAQIISVIEEKIKTGDLPSPKGT